MATYEYRCFQCGVIERDVTWSSAPASVTCSSCGREARRVYPPPMVRRTAKPVDRALALEEMCREPEVITQVPPSNRQPPIHTATGGTYA
ncbi:MAG: hypothetical protein JWN29_3915 [Acidimicrobiales bacterium]|jgi:putative FmdB family regulatory protein|nr:hypothetical protein [Acidimicrobiales bacterium]